MGYKIFGLEWQTWFTGLMLFFMLVGWCLVYWGWGNDKGWQVTWWIGFGTLLGHFIAGFDD